MAKNECLHESFFYCDTVSCEEGVTYAFVCIKRCGFWLNFDPRWAGKIQERPTPKDYKLDCWRLNTVAFLPHPSTDRLWKTSRPMAVEGAKMRTDKI